MESENEAFPVLTLHSNSSRIYLKPSSLETDFATATFFLHNISYNRQTPHQWLVQGNKDELDKEKIKINIALEEYAAIFRWTI